MNEKRERDILRVATRPTNRRGPIHTSLGSEEYWTATLTSAQQCANCMHFSGRHVCTNQISPEFGKVKKRTDGCLFHDITLAISRAGAAEPENGW